MQRFLLVKTSAIGDVIQCFHLIPYLKHRFPGATIDWVVEKGIAPLLRAHPDLCRVLEVDTKRWRGHILPCRAQIGAFCKQLRAEMYDTLFDLQGNTKSALITALAKAKKKVGFAWKDLPEKTNFFVTNAHISCRGEQSVRSRYSRLLLDFFGDDEISQTMQVALHLKPEENEHLQRMAQLSVQRPHIMICFGSHWINKQLPDEALEAVLRLVHDKCRATFFFMWGSGEEQVRAERFARAFEGCSRAMGGLSLPLWQRLMGKMDAVISVDSAALHLCATTGTPSFALFGPSSSAAYGSTGHLHDAFQGSCPYAVTFDKRCPHLRSCHTGACLRQASVERIFQHFEAFWDRAFPKGCERDPTIKAAPVAPPPAHRR